MTRCYPFVTRFAISLFFYSFPPLVQQMLEDPLSVYPLYPFPPPVRKLSPLSPVSLATFVAMFLKTSSPPLSYEKRRSLGSRTVPFPKLFVRFIVLP